MSSPYIPGGPNRPEPLGETTEVTEENFKTHEFYQKGKNFFETGYYWEAHEAWESCWRASKGRVRDFLKILIQFSGSRLKEAMNDNLASQNLENLAREGLQKLNLQTEDYLGFALKILSRNKRP